MSKTILITGASSGFGRDTAETLFRAGHTVYASMRRAEGKNREAAEALRKLGVKTVELDVSDDASDEAGVKSVLVEAGTHDGVVKRSADTPKLFPGIKRPAGIDVTKSYGEVGQIPDAMFKTFRSMFEGNDAPNPHDVAEAVAKLVGQSKGSRATRTVVGAAFGSDKANEDIAPVQIGRASCRERV